MGSEGEGVGIQKRNGERKVRYRVDNQTEEKSEWRISNLA
jgi:hypothetical protein